MKPRPAALFPVVRLFRVAVHAAVWLLPVAGAMVTGEAPGPGPSGLRRDAGGQAMPAGDVIEGEVMVKWKAGTDPARRLGQPGHMPGAEVKRCFSCIPWDWVALAPGVTVADALAWYSAQPDVERTVPNVRLQASWCAAGAPLPPPSQAGAAAVRPNDPRYSRQWGLEKISAPLAWRCGTGSDEVVIGVMDSGMDYTHPDLAPNMWVNCAEVAGNSLDDDGNGVVDDRHGIDVLDGDGDPMDVDGHGTAVAGVIGAAGNNGTGGSGMFWHVKLMALRIGSSDHFAGAAQIAAAMDYAVAMKQRGINLRVINHSWAGGGSDSGTNSEPVREAFGAAEAAGILHVCGAANTRTNVDHVPYFPAGFDIRSLLSVAASDYYDELANFTNYGPLTCDLAAPGVAIDCPAPGGTWVVQGGTSLAAPHVSGAAGLLTSLVPGLTPREIKDRLLDSVDALPQWSGRVVSGGRLNVARAVERLGQPVAPRDPFPPAVSGRVTCVSLNATRQGGDGNSGLCAVSDDGRYVVFASEAGNLVPGCTGAFLQVFLRDRQTGGTVCVSRSPGGAEGNGASDFPAMSADGRWIVFESVASNLVASDANGAVSDVFLYDRVSGALTLFSQGANAGSGVPAISADGSVIAYASAATNLAGTDGNGQARDVFVQDRLRQQQVRRVSVSAGGVAGNLESDRPALDADGSVVAFHSAADNLVPGDTNQSYDIFVRDLTAGTIERASVATGGAQSNLNGGNGYPSLSGDGRLVAFHSFAANFDPAHDPDQWDVFLRDRQAGTTRLISRAVTQRRSGPGCSVTLASDPAGGGSFNARLSRDGRCLVFESSAWRLVLDDHNRDVSDVFLHDLVTDKLSLLSLGLEGRIAQHGSFWPAVSGDGRYVVFASWAANLVTGDGNAMRDVFLLDRGAVQPDLYVADCTAVEAGRGVIGPAIEQRGLSPVTAGGTATFLVKVENDGPASAAFRLRATAASDPAPWPAQFFDAETGGNAITASVTGAAGWLTPAVPAGGRLTMRMTLTAPATGSGRNERTVSVTAAAGGPVLDSIRAVAELPVRAGDLVPASRASDAAPANDSVKNPQFSADGRYVAYLSPATNLESGVLRAFHDAFLHDRSTGRNTQLTVRANGAPINGSTTAVQISRNGVYAVIATTSTDIISSDTNGLSDIYVKDLTTGNFERASGAPNGESNGSSTSPVISGDGHYVAFQSHATNLTAAPDANRVTDIFLRDRWLGQTRCLTLTTGGSAANGFSIEPQITPDGRYVAFLSAATNLATGDTNGMMDVFVFDTQTSERRLVSRGLDGLSANGFSALTGLTDDGRYVLFASEGTNFVAGVTERYLTYLWDRTTGGIAPMNPRTPDMPADTWLSALAISPDGRWIAFQSSYPWIVTGDGERLTDVFIYDRTSGSLQPVSVTASGKAGNDHSLGGAFNADGRYFAFWSWAQNLAGESAFEASQLYVVDRGRFQPDMLVRRPGGADQGADTTAAESQTVSHTARTGQAAEFVMTLRNTSVLPDTFLVTATTADPARWCVRWYDVANSTEITAALTGAGWNPGPLAAGAARTVRVTVEPLMTGNAPLTLSLHSVSTGNAAASDTVFATTEPDDDGDTLPDSWERSFFPSLSNLNASGDPDGDGFNSLAEYTAGTHPGSGTSFPSLTAEAVPPSHITAQWPAQAGRLYLLESSNAPGVPFIPVTGFLPATPPLQSLDLPLSGPAGFLRLKITRP